jgi:hypothetical protein
MAPGGGAKTKTGYLYLSLCINEDRKYCDKWDADHD